MEMITYWVTYYGYLGIFSLLMLGIIGLPIPDETLLTFAGYLVYKGDLHMVSSVAAAFLGSVCGISLSYVLGRTVGFHVIEKYGYIFHITPDRLKQTHDWFDRVGKWSLMIGYFIPGVRHLTALIAGTSKMELHEFVLFAYTGGLIWSATFICLGYFLGEEWASVSEQIHRHLMIYIGVVAAALILYFIVKRRSPRRK